MACCGKIKMSRLHYWPILATAWFFLTFIISYSITVGKKHAYWLFPYISDTGTLPPESCVFGMMLNIAAVLMFITVYFRYRYVEIKLDELNMKLWKWNTISFVIGIIACFGIAMVANFQETSDIGGHLIGANLAFFIGAFHFYIQTYISWKLEPNKLICYSRLLLSVTFLPFFIMTSVASSKSIKELNPPETKRILTWTPDDPGYPMHLFATFSEWMLGISQIIYLCTYTHEFKEMECGGIQIRSRNLQTLTFNARSGRAEA